jgi:DNA polymerase elongation subunit (family B)
LFQGSEATPSVGIADRARHPDELKQDSGNWLIDIDYYISQQVLLDHLLSAHSYMPCTLNHQKSLLTKS